MKVAIIGSRGIKRYNLDKVMPNGVTAIVSGGAKGIDTIAAEYAKERNLKLIEFLPEYDKYPGKIAPLIRNDKIVEEADIVIAIWDGESRGTMYTVNRAKKMGKPVKVVKITNTIQDMLPF